MRPTVEPTEVVQLVVHGALYPRLADWLEADGFVLHELGDLQGEDDLRTIMVGLGDRRAGMLKGL